MKQAKKKKTERRKRPACGLCGSKTNLTKTECCGHWICDDEDQYVAFSYARNSCYRNHSRYTLCGYHDVEEHKGDWKDCKQCREDFSDNLEMYVDYGTNEYNFEKLPNPPAFEPTYCSQCGEHIIMANGGYSVRGDTYTCHGCNSGPIDFMNSLAPSDDDEEEDFDDEYFDEDLPSRLNAGSVDDLSEEMLSRFDSIAMLINQFCTQHDAFSFAILCMDMSISLCVQFPELVRRGKVESWAGGIVHALALVNFLSDASSEPYIKMADIKAFFGVSQGTIQSKSMQIRDLFGTYQMDPIWSLPELLLENPMLWIVPMDGLLVDVRQAPLKTQQKALDAGLIPMLPGTLEQHIREYKKVLAKEVKFHTQVSPVPEQTEKNEHRPNIRITDYMESKPVTHESLPLFDPVEEK